MSVSEVSLESNMRNQDVSDIWSDMLTNSQMHKENNDHENVEEVETLCEDLKSKAESLLVICAINSKSVWIIHEGRTIYR